MTTSTPPPTPTAPTSTQPAPPPAQQAPTTQTETLKPTTQRRRPKINRETAIVIALVVATAELALVAAIGSWARWLIIHAAIAVIALIVFLAKFGRNRRRATGNGTGGGRGRGLAGLLGGHGRGNVRGNGNGTGGGRGRGLAGLLGGHGTGAGGGRGRGLAGLLGGHGRGNVRGNGNGNGNGTGGGRGRGLAGLLGGHGRGNVRGNGNGTGTNWGSRGNGLGGLFGGTGGGHGTGAGGHGTGRGTGAGGHGTGRGTGRHGGGLDLLGHGGDKDSHGLLASTLGEIKKGWNAAATKDKEDPDTESEPDDIEPEPDNTEEEPAGQETPDTPATSQGESTKMVKTQGTPSLQAWGRCLPSVEQALLEKQRELRRVEADLENIAEAVSRLHNQGEQELPASPKLVALLADVQASLNRLPLVSEVIGKIASNANALAPLYRTEHTGDEDRLAGMRGGVEREKRSDVGEAQKDT